MFRAYQNYKRFPPVEKKDSAFRLWFKYVLRNKGIYTLGFFAVLLTNITEISIPKLIEYTLNKIQNSEELKSNTVFLALISIFLTQALTRFLWRQTMAQQSHVASAGLLSAMWKRIHRLPFQRLNKDFSVGKLMNIASGDVNTAKFIFGFTMIGTIDFFFLLSFALAAMFWIHWKLTLICLILVPFLPFWVHKLSKKEGTQHDHAQQSLSKLSEEVSQSLNTVKMQKLTQSEAFWKERLLAASSHYKAKRWKLLKTELLFIPTTCLSPWLSNGLLLFLSIPMLMDGRLNLGSFVAFHSYVYLITDPLMELGWIVSEWQLSLTSLKRWTALFKAQTDSHLETKQRRLLKKHPIQDSKSTRLLKTEALSFHYPESSQKIIYKLNLKLEKGEKLGITGPIASGKSTLMRLLSGMETSHYSGKIFYKEAPLLSYDPSRLRNDFALVPQRSFLFADTIKGNLQLGTPLSDEKLWFYLHLAGLDEEVKKWPSGLNTALGEGGVNLSGGQKQRLTLARALAREPEILFLDDCFSAVDTLTEEKILSRLKDHFNNRSVLWIAHRESTLRYCDRIKEIKNEL